MATNEVDLPPTETTAAVSSSNTSSPTSLISSTAKTTTIKFVYPMKNFTKLSGGKLNLRCEVQADPPVTKINWFRNEAPLKEEKGRVKIRTRTGTGDSQWSRVRIKPLETHDTGFYRCQVDNGLQTLSAESMVKVHLRSRVKGWGLSGGSDIDYVDEHHDEHEML